MPADPMLPLLDAASDAVSAALIVEQLGLQGAPKPVLLAHREGQRAVVRWDFGASSAYCKLVPSGSAERLVGLHRALRAAGLPVPRVLGYAHDGLVVLASSDGEAGPNSVLKLAPSTLLDAVDTMRIRIAKVRIRHDARASISTKIDWFLEQLATLLPGQESQLAELVPFVGPTQHPSSRRVPIHGDLHLGQLFFSDEAVSGVIDVDTVGLGNPDDDSAAFVAHAVASALINYEANRPAAGDALAALADAADARWLTTSHARALAAVHLLGHAYRAASADNAERAVTLIEFAQRLRTRVPSAA